MLPSLPMMFFHQKPDPEIPQEQIETVEEMRVDTIDLIYAIETRLVPNLGRFVFIHTVNNTLLVLAILFSTTLLSSDIKTISMLLTIIVWAILPVFEVDEYDRLLSNDVFVFSLPLHIISVIISTLILLGVENIFYISIPFSSWSFSFQYNIQSSILIIGLIVLTSIWIFSTMLENELDSTIDA